MASSWILSYLAVCVRALWCRSGFLVFAAKAIYLLYWRWLLSMLQLIALDRFTLSGIWFHTLERCRDSLFIGFGNSEFRPTSSWSYFRRVYLCSSLSVNTWWLEVRYGYSSTVCPFFYRARLFYFGRDYICSLLILLSLLARSLWLQWCDFSSANDASSESVLIVLRLSNSVSTLLG